MDLGILLCNFKPEYSEEELWRIEEYCHSSFINSIFRNCMFSVAVVAEVKYCCLARGMPLYCIMEWTSSCTILLNLVKQNLYRFLHTYKASASHTLFILKDKTQDISVYTFSLYFVLMWSGILQDINKGPSWHNL